MSAKRKTQRIAHGVTPAGECVPANVAAGRNEFVLCYGPAAGAGFTTNPAISPAPAP